MEKKLKRVPLLLLTLLLALCFALVAVACNDVEGEGDGDGDGDPAKVTYSVTVTVASDVTGVTLTSLKAQWYSGSTAACDAVALDANGKASVELDSGNYTVKLVGVPDTATYQEKSVTAASPAATINITKKGENPDTPPPAEAKVLEKVTNVAVSAAGLLTWTKVDNASSYTVYEGATVLATKVAATQTPSFDLHTVYLPVGPHSITVQAIGDGVSYKDGPKSDPALYTVSATTLTGDGSDYWYQDETYTWTYHEGDAYQVTEVGTYTVPVGFEVRHVREEYDDGNYVYEYDVLVVYAQVIEFTAPKAGEHTYTFSWDPDVYALSYLNAPVFGDPIINEDDSSIYYNDNVGVVVFSLEKDETIRLVLSYEYYLEEDEELEEGDLSYELSVTYGDPVTEGSLYDPYVLETLEGTHTGPVGVTEGYFALPFNFDSDTFAVTFTGGVKVFVLQYGAGSTPEAIESGDEITPGDYNSTYIYATAPAGTRISFTFTKVVSPGSIERPIEVTKDEVASYTFVGWNNAWFTFTPAASQYYRISTVEDYFFSPVTVYSDAGETQLVEVSEDGRNDVYLTSGTKYYLELRNFWGSEVAFKVIDTPAEAPIQKAPKALTTGLNEELPAGAEAYYSYTAAAGDYYFRFDLDNLTVYPYTDAHYTVVYGEGEYYSSFVFSLEEGETMYFCINGEMPFDGDDFLDNYYVSVQKIVDTLLTAPENVDRDDDVLTWDAVEGADYYVIHYDFYVQDGDEEEGYTYELYYSGILDRVIAVEETENYTYNIPHTELTTGYYVFSVSAAKNNPLSATEYYPESETACKAEDDYYYLEKCNYEVGEEYDVVIGVGTTGVKTGKMYLKKNVTYTFILKNEDGETDGLESIRILEDNEKFRSNQAVAAGSFAGTIIEYEQTATSVKFTVPATGVYTFRFVDLTWLGKTIMFQVVVGDEEIPYVPPVTLRLDTAATINLNEDGTNYGKLEISYPGKYKIVLNSVATTVSGYTVSVNNGSALNFFTWDGVFAMFDFDDFEIFDDGLPTLKINFNKGTSSLTQFNVTVSYAKPLDIVPESLGEEGAVTGIRASKNKGLDKEADSYIDDLGTVGQIDFSSLSLRSGSKYTIVVTDDKTSTADYRFIYNGEEYESYRGAMHNGQYCISFTKAGDTFGYFYAIGSGNPSFVTLYIDEYQDGDEPVGLKEGDSVTVTGGLDESSAVTVNFGIPFTAGVKYQILPSTLGPGPSMAYWYVSYNDVLYVDRVQGFNLSSFEFTAVEGGLLKVYGAALEIVFTISHITEPVNGLTVGTPYVVAKEKVGDGNGNNPFGWMGEEIPLVGLLDKTTYRVTITMSPGDASKTFNIGYNDQKVTKVQFDTFEFTYTASATSLKVLVNYDFNTMSNPMVADVTLTLTAA